MATYVTRVLVREGDKYYDRRAAFAAPSEEVAAGYAASASAYVPDSDRFEIVDLRVALMADDGAQPEWFKRDDLVGYRDSE